MSARLRFVGLAVLLLVAAGGLAQSGSDAVAARFQRLGAQLICPCGCTQGALVCNHVGCPVVTQLRAEILQRAQSTDSDALVLQSFVQEYGTQVLANPTTEGFNLLAWVMPWAALGLGILLVLWFVKRWRHTPAPVAAAGIDSETRARVHQEIAMEIAAETADIERGRNP